jgi:uncharacterized membrane protein
MVIAVSILAGRGRNVIMFYKGIKILPVSNKVSRENTIFQKKILLIIAFGLSIWISGIIVTPLFAASEGIFWQKTATFMYFFYKPVCHQITDRSFLIDGFTMTVCVRCFAFYLGGFIVTIFYIFKERIEMWRTSMYVLLAFPVFLDFSVEKLKFYSNITELRFFTGLLFGVMLFHLLLLSLSTKKSKPELHHSKTPTIQ